jgi:hypothetical protein
MKNQIRIHLGRLASIEYQRRFCIGATKDEYVLLDEILESAANTAQVVLGSAVLSKHFTPKELASIRDFLDVADDMAKIIPFDSQPVDLLIEDNDDWKGVCDAAQRCPDELALTPSLADLSAHPPTSAPS